MGAIWGSVIPGAHKEFTTGSDVDLGNSANMPGGAKHVVGLRVNDVTSGGSLKLKMSGADVTYDNLSEGENLVGRFSHIVASGSSVDSVIVYYA